MIVIMQLRHFVLLLYVLTLLDSTPSEAMSLSKFRNYHQGRLELGAGLDFMTSTSNFDSGSSIRDLSSKAGYQLIRTPLGVRYGYGETWGLSSTLMISTAQSKNIDATRNNSSIPEIHLGADALLYRGFVDWTGELQLIFPLETIKSTQDTAFNSEGVTQLLGWVGFDQRKSNFIWYGQGGFNYRMEGRSSLLMYEAGAGLRWNRNSFGAELGGFQSVMDDGDKGSEAKRNAVIQRVNGGSFRFYSVNPSVMEFRLWSEHEISSRFKLDLNVAYPFSGSNYANGMTFGAVVSMAFDLMETQKSIRRLSVPVNEAARIGTDKKVEDFHEVIEDGVDQEIFQPPPPPPQPKPSGLRSRPHSLQPTRDDVKNQLDDTEMTIQLKSIKKKKRKK